MGDTERTIVLIVGAGASREFKLPTGEELKSKFSSIVNIRYEDGIRLKVGDPLTVECLKVLAAQHGDGRNYNSFLHEGRFIYENMPLAPSIDNFLDTHRDRSRLVAFGKLAIAQAILTAERSSLLFIDPRKEIRNLDFSSVSETWAHRFFRILVAQRTFSDFMRALGRITFVSFNYDRCIKQFFYKRLGVILILIHLL